jgi:predicted dienelactone hydrolase
MKIAKALGILAPLLLAAACGTLWEGLATQGPPPGSESARRLAPGPYAVGRRDSTFVDESRRTPALGDFPGAPSRTLETTLWYPKGAEGPHPLLIYCHGFMSNRRGGAYLAEHLASYGYVVAAADFPHTHGDAPGGPDLRDTVNQPGDVSFLIGALLALEEGVRPFRAGVDPRRIGVMGLSLGGLTTTLTAFHPELRDPRIQAAISIAGPGAIFSRRFFETAAVPFLMIAASEDAIVPYPANGPPILERAPSAALVTIEGGSHTGFADVAALVFRFSHHPDAAGCRALGRRLPLDRDAENPLLALGGPEVGIVFSDDAPRPCQRAPLPRAMRPQRQHLITMLAVRAFFEREFGRSAESREAASRYLARTLAEDLGDAAFASFRR